MPMKNGAQNILRLNRKNALISIIVLTYRNQSFLNETLKSILEQDYPRIELIISDDASGCFNREKVEKFINIYKKDNIEFLTVRINEYNLGTVKHANLIINYANGDYIKYVSCGDKFFDSNSLTKLYEFAFENDSMVTSSAVLFCSEDFKKSYYKHPNAYRTNILKSSSSLELFRSLCIFNMIPAISILYREDFFELYKFDERYKLLEDWPMWLRISRDGIKICHLDTITMYYAEGGVSSVNLDAFSSKRLHDDLIRCYKLEIFPYIHDLSFFKKQYIKYKFESLNRKNIKFYIKNFIFLAFDEIKHFVKCQIKRR